MFNTGYLANFRWGKIPIRIHWTLLLGCVFISGFRFRPGLWLGFLLLILLHELGHATLVWRMGLKTEAIQIHGLGGECLYGGTPSAYQRSIIAWGGVLAQALLLVATLSIQAVWGPIHAPLVGEMLHVFIEPNLLLIGLNLLPFAPLDGGEAWKFFRLHSAQRNRRKSTSATRTSKTKKSVKKDAAQTTDFVRETVREALDRAKRESRNDSGKPN